MAPQVCKVMEDQIQVELDNGRYKRYEYPMTITSVLRAVPKPQSNKIRLIHDCSRPIGRAVNDMADNPPTFSYQSFQEALTAINPGAWMAKLDLASAYHLVKIQLA